MGEYDEFDELDVNGSITNEPSNVLEKGRYPFVVKEVRKGISKNENPTLLVKLEVEGYEVVDFLVMKGRMEWKFKKFLYCIGIRSKSQNFKVTKERLVGAKGLVDVGVRDRELEDGSSIPQNLVRDYSPIENEEAPIKDVPPETEESKKIEEEPEKKPEKKEPEKSKEEEEDDGI